MAKTTTKKELVCNPPARLVATLRDPRTRYLGPVVLQAAGGWTRYGPCWITAQGEWIVWGPGVNHWGTKEGLAELASADTANPTWHASGWAMAPDPNIAFCGEPASVAKYTIVEQHAEAADRWIEEGS